MKYLVSACLLGENCKYNGGNNYCAKLVDFLRDKEVVCVCPEVLGGLPTPRPCAEICDGRVINCEHEDVSKAFQRGADRALAIAKAEKIDLAILQSRSPSCGKGSRYSGRFDGTLVAGNGIFVDRLEAAGFMAVDIAEFLSRLHHETQSE